MNPDQLARIKWRKSSFSDADNICVEVAGLPDGGRAIRDSKTGGTGPILVFTDEWTAFTQGVKDGEFD